MASKSEWGGAELERVNFLSKRLDISKRIFHGYRDNGRKAVDMELSDPVWLELAAAILLKMALLPQTSLPVEICLKRFNTLFKAIDLIEPEWLSSTSELREALESAWHILLGAFPMPLDNALTARRQALNVCQDNQGLTVIPLTVLFYEGPIARAYLEVIKGLGFKPQKIIELVAAKDVATKKLVGKWLPQGMRKSYAATIQRNKIHYWPKQLSKTKAGLVNGILAEVEERLGFSKGLIEHANALLPLSTYSDCVESLLVEGLSDKGLHQYLSKEPIGAILYTGGGIVPATLLAIQQLKFLHIHPGFLPDIRGADCALWSSLLTGHMSATCFYMSPGIDTGEIIHPCWLPAFSFDVDTQDVDLRSIYRIVYGFLDPWVRAFVLREIIGSDVQFDALNSVPQSEGDGTTFHFMHRRLQQAAFKRLFHFEGEI
ncbi:MAG: hypothetical protein L3J28_04840 [Candidatus Polarisedimenticolaceae bacterium]|nr:hypothetical protein [Candidatus Polarisedimenticolaceae bacterium]